MLTKVLHGFAYPRLLTCGHCGCALVGKIKKGRCIYYHCTGFQGKCPKPYTHFDLLYGITQETEKTAASGNSGDRFAFLLPRLDSNQ